MHRFFLTCALIPLALIAQDSIQDDCCESAEIQQEQPMSSCSPVPSQCPDFLSQKRKPMRTTLRHIEAGGIGYQHGYTSLDLVLGTQTEQFYPFLDLRGHYFNNGKWAANGGFGFRYLPSDWDTIFGFNAYYDYRRDHKTNFQQAGAGLEFLRAGWEARINGYLPFGTKSSGLYDAKFAYFQGNSIYLKAKKYVAMAGGDAEVGYNILTNKKGCSLYFGMGPYYYHPPCGSNAFGGRARLTAKFTDYLSVDVIETYDNVFHNNTQGQISLNIPFGSTETRQSNHRIPPALEFRMVQPVVRDEIIVVNSCKQYPVAINPTTGLPYFVLFVNNQSNSLGTFESPYPTLAQAQTASSPNDLIYVYPGNGTTTGMNAGITLKDYQQLLGSAVSHPIATQFGLITIPSLTSGFSPIIANSSGAVVTVGNGNTVSGFYIQFLNGAGITNGSTARTNLNVSDNVLEGSGFNAVDLSSAHLSGIINVVDNQFNIDDYAVAVTNSGLQNATYSILNNYITSTDTTAAINLSYTNCAGLSTTISGNTIKVPGASVAVVVNNTSTPSASNTFNLENNYFASRATTFPITLQGSSNTSFSFDSNTLFSAVGSAISTTAASASATSFSVNGSSINTAIDSTTLGSFIFAGTNTGASNFSFSNNTTSGSVGFNISVQDCPVSYTADGNLMNNTFQCMSLAYTGTAQANVSITNNNIVSGNLASTASITSSGGSATSSGITIANNTIQNNGSSALGISLTSSDNGVIVVTGNTLTNQSTSASVLSITSTGVNPITISNNLIESRGLITEGCATISLAPPSGTLQSVSVANNTLLSSVGRGINMTVNGASANTSLSFTGNTINTGERGIIVTLTNAASVSTTVLNNTIESNSLAFFLDASTISSAIPLSCNMQNNSFQVGNNNAVKFSVTAAAFNSTIKNNQFGLIVYPPYVREQLLISYTGSAAPANATVNIDSNRFLSADQELAINVLGTAANMTASITNNYFGLSGSTGSSGATVALTTNNSSNATWTIGGNTFESWDTSALTVTTLNTSTACVQFTGNQAQPIPSAYSFVQTGGTLTLSQSNNVGEISNTGSSGTCP